MAEGDETGLIDGSSTEEVELDGGEETFVEEETPGGEEEITGGGEEELSRGEEETAGSRAIVKFTPTQVKLAVRELTTANPEFAKKFPNIEKAISTALFKDSRISELGGLSKINQAMEAIEVYGGVEAIAEMRESLDAYGALERGFAEGDPAVVKGWAKDFPVGLVKSLLPAAEEVKRIDPEYYDAFVSHLIKETFDRCGVTNTIARMGEALATLEAGKDGGAIRPFNELAKFVGDMIKLAGSAKRGAERNADQDAREQELNDREKVTFYASVREPVNTKVMSEINRLIRLQLKPGQKIKVDRANRLRKEINAETNRRVNAQSGYLAARDAVMASRNRERAIQFYVNQAKKFLPRVVRELVNEFNLVGTGTGGGSAAQRRTGGNNGVRTGGTVAGRPKTSEVDFTRTDKAHFLATMNSHGEAWGLDGKLHKW